MKATLTLILAVIAAQISFADGLVSPTLVSIKQDTMAGYSDLNVSNAKQLVKQGLVLQLVSLDAQFAHLRIGNENYTVPVSVVSMIDANHPDYAQAVKILNDEIRSENQFDAQRRSDQQAADRNDAVKNPNVTVHIDNP